MLKRLGLTVAFNVETPVNRTCGACTLCCKVLRIDELEKPAGVWCANCAPGRGCKVYERRPGSCRTFVCEWLSTPQTPDALRPDRSKVVLALDANGTRLIAHCDEAAPLAWRRGPMLEYLREQAHRGRGRGFVIARVGESLWLVTADHVFPMGRVPASVPYRFETREGRFGVSLLKATVDGPAEMEFRALAPETPSS